jgi:formylglycine-generating enzyme required for sulfatase activity
MVEIGDYGVCIDAYEVTVEQFAGFLNAHGNDCKVEGYWDMRGLYACFAEGYGSGEQIEKQGDTWSFEQGMENYPVYGVTYFGAKQACEQWGKSLCTLEAWELACGGPDDLLYPYGNTFEMDVCNSETLDCDFPSVKEIGSYPQCEGGYPGIFDMSGNVGEWVDFCWYSEYSHHYVCATPGGTGCGPKEHATCRYPDEPSDPQLEAVYDFNEKLGFRCCLYLD